MTITGTIRGIDNVAASWTLTFVPQSTPGAVSSLIIVGLDKKITTDAVGDFSLELIEGTYIVRVGNGEEFEIDVPTGAGPQNIYNLITPVSDTSYRISGHGSPEGRYKGSPGWTYLDVDTANFWTKLTGTGTTGWNQQTSA